MGCHRLLLRWVFWSDDREGRNWWGVLRVGGRRGPLSTAFWEVTISGIGVCKSNGAAARRICVRFGMGFARETGSI